jgi:AAA family ATP:ADP antiporter
LIGIFYGDFFGWVNLVSLLIQLFVVSRVFRRVGVSGALFVLPLVAFASYGVLAMAPVLAAVRIGKIVENSADYSLQNTARHALFLPTSREAKYKAKQVIDGFFWRAGDVLQALLIFIGVRLAFGVSQFALLNQLLVVIWLAVIVAIYREHRRLVASEGPRRAAA